MKLVHINPLDFESYTIDKQYVLPNNSIIGVYSYKHTSNILTSFSFAVCLIDSDDNIFKLIHPYENFSLIETIKNLSKDCPDMNIHDIINLINL